MQVEQIVHRGEESTQLSGSRQLSRVAWAVECRWIPQPVEVLIHPAAGFGLIRRELPEGTGIGERKAQLAAYRTNRFAQQSIDRPRTADLVAMRQGIDADVRTGHAAVEGVHVVDAGIAGTMKAQVGDIEKHNQSWVLASGVGI
jgi:hypothetical protein